jgi:putative membrane protein
MREVAMRLPMLAAAVVGAVVLGTVPASAAPMDPPDPSVPTDPAMPTDPTALPTDPVTPDPTDTTAPSALSVQDSRFVITAGYAGNFEVAAGSLAHGRGYSQGVRDFGTRMVGDHNRAGTRLSQLARANGMSTPDLPDSAQQNILNAWSRLDGLLFDCAYVPAEYLDHVGAIAMFENEADHGDDPDIVAFARDTLPTLREHQRMIATALTALDCNG